IFLLFVVGGSLTLFALRAPVVKSQVGFALWSRETLLLANNLALAAQVGWDNPHLLRWQLLTALYLQTTLEDVQQQVHQQAAASA
ncbi:hypothetical protein NL323_30815, partial [Klebsiella pneumoniae]|nr:hypothetical protein [Klebsiella pneumoniae]